MRAIALSLALVASPVGAQVVTAPPTGTSAVDTAARAAAAEAKSAADAAAAAIPVPASTVPGMETIGGAAGSANTFRRGDAVQPRISRTVSGTTGANGQATISWPAMPSAPKLTVTPYVTSAETQVPTCYPVAGTVTTTGAVIKCFRTQTLLGLGLIPFTVAPAGVQFDVLALPGS
jgi:hypothetical protein